MSTSVPPRDGGARTGSPSTLTPPSGIVLADEQALKRAFDAEFESCLTSARSHLGDAPTLAPRVVEGAFVNVWNKRGSITTPTQLASVLAEEVQHGAARALSRRASGSRFGAVGGKDKGSAHAASAGAADAAVVWKQIETTIHGSATTGTHAVPGAAGHEAASHMKTVGKGRSWVIPIAIGVVALVASIAGVRYFDRLGEDDAVLQTVDNTAIQPLAGSESGQIGTLALPDSSKVRMAPQTKLYAPDGFPSTIRAIRLEGTAMFDVAKGRTLPFRVVAKKVHVIATGTQFVVTAYPSDSGVGVQVREGSVTVKTGSTVATVAAGQAVHVEKGAIRPATDDEKVAGFSWVDGQVGAHGPLHDVVDALTRWFDYDVKLPDLSLTERDASFNVPLDSSRLAISQVEKSANVKFAYEGEAKVFRDAKKK